MRFSLNGKKAVIVEQPKRGKMRIGYREFELTWNMILKSIHFSYLFEPGATWVAECGYFHEEKTPHEVCYCGFYSYKSYAMMVLGQCGRFNPVPWDKEIPESLTRYKIAIISCNKIRNLTAEVVPFGKVWRHEFGYRSSKIGLRSITWPRCLKCDSLMHYVEIKNMVMKGIAFGCPDGTFVMDGKHTVKDLVGTKQWLEGLAAKYNVGLMIEEKGMVEKAEAACIAR